MTCKNTEPSKEQMSTESKYTKQRIQKYVYHLREMTS